MLPGDVVLPMLIKMDVIQNHPKSEKLSNVISGDDGVVADFEDPSVPSNSLPNLSVLSPGGLIDVWGDLLGLTAKEPRRIPERRFGSITQRNGGGGIKET